MKLWQRLIGRFSGWTFGTNSYATSSGSSGIMTTTLLPDDMSKFTGAVRQELLAEIESHQHKIIELESALALLTPDVESAIEALQKL